MSMIKNKASRTEVAVRNEIKDLSLSKTMELGQVFAASGMFGDVKTKAEAVVKIYAGREIGIAPVMAMSKLFMVNGKVAIPAVIMGGLIKSSGRYNYRVKKLDDTECSIQFLEKDGDKWIEIGVGAFSFAEAKLAKLTTKVSWENYRQDMLFARALSRGARRYCPDAINGAYVVEEMDMPEKAGTPSMSDKISKAQAVAAEKNAQNGALEAEISENGDNVPEQAESPEKQTDNPILDEIKPSRPATVAKIKEITELRKGLPGETAEDRTEVYETLKLSVGLADVQEEEFTTVQANELIKLLTDNVIDKPKSSPPAKTECPTGYCQACFPIKKKKLGAAEKKLSAKKYNRDLCFACQKKEAKEGNK